MSLRFLQTRLAIGNCVYGGLLLGMYGHEALHPSVWPLTLDQQVLWLVALSVLPIAAFGVWAPLTCGILEFATAFVGNQMLHDAPFPDLRLASSISMTIALVILGLVVFRGILQVTREAFGEAEDPDERQAHAA